MDEIKYNKQENDAQRMVDSIVAMQDEWPMPEEGWGAFVRDIEYTNKKRGWNIKIREQK